MESDGESAFDSSKSSDSEGEGPPTSTVRNLFPLPQVQRPTRRQAQAGEPLVDYSKSILMTSEEYIAAMTGKATRKAEVVREREERKKHAEQKKAQRQ